MGLYVFRQPIGQNILAPTQNIFHWTPNFDTNLFWAKIKSSLYLYTEKPRNYRKRTSNIMPENFSPRLVVRKLSFLSLRVQDELFYPITLILLRFNYSQNCGKCNVAYLFGRFNFDQFMANPVCKGNNGMKICSEALERFEVKRNHVFSLIIYYSKCEEGLKQFMKTNCSLSPT